MKLNDIPKLMPVPFGVSGPRTELLESSPAGDRKASYKDGFPPITMLLKSAGGLPPDGGNMNQILFELASGQRWSNAGAGYKFNATFSDAVGGYPKGAQLLSNDGTKVYVSTKDDNKIDFNASPGPDWVTLGDYIGLGNYATKTGVGLKLDKNSVVQSTGTSTTNVMSQKTVTDELNKKFDKTGGTITANGKSIELKTTATGNPAYIQITDSAGNIIHQFGKLSDNDDFSIYNAAEGIGVTLTSQGLSVGGNPVALAKDVLKIDSNLSDVKNKQTARNNLGLGAAALLGAPVAVTGEDGYIQIPALVNGVETNLILQWMTVGLNKATGSQMYSRYVNWPTPFPNACLSTLSSIKGVGYDPAYNPVTSSVIIDRTKVEVGTGYSASASNAFVWGVGY
ncbi:TPA: hypothetical protein ON737_001413 [Morganella morganii]|nr:hypothetical protein [Morganella morganii]HCR3760435.1 hypothetical protein [Morganella morganii]